MVILVIIQLLMTRIFHERIKVINNNFPLGQDNKKDKRKNVITVGNSILNNINSRGLSKVQESIRQ